MKYIEIIIRPSMYFATKEKLVENGFYASFCKDVLGRGKQGSQYETVSDSKPHETGIQYVAKKYIGMYILDEYVEDVIKCVKAVNHTGNCGDGKIFVTNIEEAVRISTGQRGEDALV